MFKHSSVLLVGIALISGPVAANYSMEQHYFDWSVGKQPFYEPSFFVPVLPVRDAPPSAVFYVHSGRGAYQDHYIPSGWMGDYGDLRLSSSYIDNPSHNPTCIKITYSGQQSNHVGWAGIYWQNPGNNWGTMAGGYNLAGMRRLTFWARGEHGGEVISVFKIGGIQGQYMDSDTAQIGPVRLTADWKEYVIDLRNVNLSHVIGGFAWSTGHADNPEPITFYMDEIRYER